MGSYNFHPRTRQMLNREFLQILTDSPRELSAREAGKQFAKTHRKPTMSSGRASIILRRLFLQGKCWRRFHRSRRERTAAYVYRAKGRTSRLRATHT